MRTNRPWSVAAGLAAVLALGLAAPAAADDDELGPPYRTGGDVEVTVTVPGADDDGSGGPADLTNAELRWAVNHESVGANFFGGCNFLMAGVPGPDGDAGGSRVWSAADRDLYAARDGDVRVERASGDLQSYASRCSDPSGDELTMSAGNTSGSEIVVDGGVGERGDDGSVQISWTGSFTVVFYGGLTYWWASDPVLELDEDGDGTLTATVGGYATDREDTTKWSPLREREVPLATFSGGRLVDAGGVLTPDWCGVRVEGTAQAQLREDVDGVCWGAFPGAFVDFQVDTGQGAYWYTSGSSRDRFKRPYDVTVSFDADASLGPTDTGSTGSGGSGGGSGSAAGGSGSVDGTFAPAVVPSSSAGTAGSLGTAARVPVPAAGDSPAFLPAVAASTLGADDGTGLVPALTDAVDDPGERLAFAGAGLMLAAAGAIVGFRRRWLVLPFT